MVGVRRVLLQAALFIGDLFMWGGPKASSRFRKEMRGAACISCEATVHWTGLQRMWLVQEVLRKLLSRLTRLAKTAEDFRALASPHWAPRIGAYVNAAHWLAHSLQEAAGPLLLLDLEGACSASTSFRWCHARMLLIPCF